MSLFITEREDVIEYLKKFYLCVMKNKKLLKSSLENKAIAPLDVDLQEKILDVTVRLPMCRKYPPSITYQKFFLRTFIDNVEAYGSEISDSLIEEYTNILQVPTQENISYCSYIISDDCTISLQESPCLVAKSTTGLQTWEASKYLCEWCKENISHFENKRVLELGSGVGLLGLTVLKLAHPSSYTFTDKSWEVLNVLSKNIALNFDEQAENPNFQKLQLVWSTVCKEDADRIAPDIILGADLAYDPEMFESLLHALKIFLAKGSVHAFLANGIRNMDTNNKFVMALRSTGLEFEIIPPLMKYSFIYEDLASFVLYKIYMQ